MIKKNLKRWCICAFIICLVLFGASCKKCKEDGENPTPDPNITDKDKCPGCNAEGVTHEKCPTCGGYVCVGDHNHSGKKYDNETDTLVFSTQDLDKVFNPFFSTSATDSNVIGFTQIGMLGNDKDGKPVWGDEHPVVVKDLEQVTVGVKDDGQTTTYKFVLKNNVRFSNGSYLTIKDVLFNLYVYLDPVYTGSSTIYSTDIVGLKAYRTQIADEEEQKNFKKQFEIQAKARIDALTDAAVYVFDNHDYVDGAEEFKQFLTDYLNELDEDSKKTYANIVADFEKACALFKEELQNDFSNAKDSYDSITFSDENGKVYKDLLTTNVEAFLYNEGYLNWNKKDAKLESTFTNDPTELKSWTEEKAIQMIYEDKIPNDIEEIVTYWNTASKLNEYLQNIIMEEYYKGSTRQFPNISGIQFANRTESVIVNGVTYDVPTYNADGSVASGYEVLTITINNVDPKAIWNFSFGVAPMYYYSDAEHIAKFDFVSNFGVEYSSPDFMSQVVGNPDKNSVPVGAGPYAASRNAGGIDNVKGSEFYNLGIVHFERNPYYVMGPAKIKKMRLKVVPANQMLSSLYQGEVDFVEPNAKPETISELNNKISDGIGNKSVQTAGYGYIGINAGKVPDIAVRQAIMHTMNTQLCVDYYKSTAEAIHRSMSKSSWAYPDGCTAYYPYIGGVIPEDLEVVNPDYYAFVLEKGKAPGDKFTKAEQQEFLRRLVEDKAGYILNGNGVYQKGNHILKYTFTVAGEETDHPAWQAMFNSSEILNEIGFQINVTTDSNALKKLSQGALTVWAAAWGSTIDPDMYQVYHKESNATSVLNWGYKQILQNVGGKYDVENELINQLSDLIDQARQTTNEDERRILYSAALDIVMELAIELPTYQRDDLFAYNTNRIDVNSLTPSGELSAYKGLTSDIHKVSFVVQ